MKGGGLAFQLPTMQTHYLELAFGGCSFMATHSRRTRIICRRFIFSASIVARPTGVNPKICVASSFHAKCSSH